MTSAAHIRAGLHTNFPPCEIAISSPHARRPDYPRTWCRPRARARVCVLGWSAWPLMGFNREPVWRQRAIERPPHRAPNGRGEARAKPAQHRGGAPQRALLDPPELFGISQRGAFQISVFLLEVADRPAERAAFLFQAGGSRLQRVGFFPEPADRLLQCVALALQLFQRRFGGRDLAPRLGRQKHASFPVCAGDILSNPRPIIPMLPALERHRQLVINQAILFQELDFVRLQSIRLPPAWSGIAGQLWVRTSIRFSANRRQAARNSASLYEY